MKLLLAIVLLILSTFSYAIDRDTFLRQQTLKLDEGMSSTEVIKILGKPDSVSQSTCGTNTKAPWTCRTYIYNAGPYGGLPVLRITFAKEKGTWVINDWTAY